MAIRTAFSEEIVLPKIAWKVLELERADARTFTKTEKPPEGEDSSGTRGASGLPVPSFPPGTPETVIVSQPDSAGDTPKLSADKKSCDVWPVDDVV